MKRGCGTTRKRKSESKRKDNALGSLFGMWRKSDFNTSVIMFVLVIKIDSRLPIVLFVG